MKFVFLGFIESLLTSHQFFTFGVLIHGSLKFFRNFLEMKGRR